MDESTLLQAARDGDEDAYAALVEEHRASLHAHCYRMLGSVPDAEDALQESPARSLARSPQVRGPQFAADLAVHDRDERLPQGDRAPAEASYAGRLRDPPATRTPSSTSRWSSRCGSALPGPIVRAAREVELAFIVALQHLPARQRAVLILRDVLGFSGAEVAEALEILHRPRSTAHCSEPTSRSRSECPSRVSRRRPQPSVMPGCGAWSSGTSTPGSAADVDALVDLLTEDAVIAMPPYRTGFAGRGRR